MLGSLNKAMLLGNLTRDPELRSTQNGTRVANFTVATNERWRDQGTGEKKERAEFHRVTAWGELAKIVEKLLVKGSKVYLEGKIETRKWQDQQGQDRYSTEIVLRGYDGKIVLLSGGRQRDDDREPTTDNRLTTPLSDPAQQGPPSPSGGELDDEIPFAPLRSLP